MAASKWMIALAGFWLACCAPAHASDLARKLEAAAQKGNAEASYHLGMLYNNGIGVEQDPKRAFAHFKAASDAGDPLGAYKVGCYYAGQFEGVVAVDEREALRHKLVAAEAGYSLAQIDVAIIHARREEYGTALRWLEAAGRQGSALALSILSAFYKQGLGTAPSRAKTYAFLKLAVRGDESRLGEGAAKQLNDIAASMSSDERAEAERLEKSWVTGPTPLTRLAASGLDRAKQVAGEAR